jgi:hypothetical protein
MSVLARFVALASLPVLWLAAGCTSQGEGERCSMNADCQSQFFCFFTISSSVGVCCSGTSTIAACNPGVVVDSGSVEMDAATEAAVEEAATDAGASEEAATGTD